MISVLLNRCLIVYMRLVTAQKRRRSELNTRIFAAGIGFFVLFSGLFGCGEPPGVETIEISQSDLADCFSVISPRMDPDAREFYAHFPVMRRGHRKDAMVLIAPTAVHASLAGYAGPVKLIGSAAQVFNLGDGIQLDIFLQENGTKQRVYNRYFDAGRLAEDRDWISLSVPLELNSSTDNWLEIQVSGGPQGDYIADWLALNGVRIEPGK
jgi:hypothetical protein